MLTYASSAGSKHREVPAVMMDMTNLTFLSLAANVLHELPGTHFTCFTGTKVQILTHKALVARWIYDPRRLRTLKSDPLNLAAARLSVASHWDTGFTT